MVSTLVESSPALARWSQALKLFLSLTLSICTHEFKFSRFISWKDNAEPCDYVSLKLTLWTKLVVQDFLIMLALSHGSASKAEQRRINELTRWLSDCHYLGGGCAWTKKLTNFYHGFWNMQIFPFVENQVWLGDQPLERDHVCEWWYGFRQFFIIYWYRQLKSKTT